MPGLGFDALVLTTIGRTSGLERPTPVGWFLGQDDSRLIVASAIGAARNPAWYDNLAAHPDQVWIERRRPSSSQSGSKLRMPVAWCLAGRSALPWADRVRAVAEGLPEPLHRPALVATAAAAASSQAFS